MTFKSSNLIIFILNTLSSLSLSSSCLNLFFAFSWIFSSFSVFSSFIVLSTLNLLFSCDSSSNTGMIFSFPWIFNAFSELIKLFLNLYLIVSTFLTIFLVVIFISFGIKSFVSVISSTVSGIALRSLILKLLFLVINDISFLGFLIR